MQQTLVKCKIEEKNAQRRKGTQHMATPQFLQPALKTELVHKKEEFTAYDPTGSAAFISLNSLPSSPIRSFTKKQALDSVPWVFFFPPTLLLLALKSSSAASDARWDLQWPRRCSLICCARRPIWLQRCQKLVDIKYSWGETKKKQKKHVDMRGEPFTLFSCLVQAALLR